MMIASPTAASAAATVMTKNTKICPATPYTCANATKLRFTALSMSSTHMNTMIAFRRVSTPTTPMQNSTALKKRASASMDTLLSLAEHHGANHGGEEQHARHLEGQQVLMEQRTSERRDGAGFRHLLRDGAFGQCEQLGNLRFREREELREQRNA